MQHTIFRPAFLSLDWTGLDEDEDAHVWEDNWDDDNVEDDFSNQLRAELEKHGYKMETSQFLQNMEWFNTELWIDFIEKEEKMENEKTHLVHYLLGFIIVLYKK